MRDKENPTDLLCLAVFVIGYSWRRSFLCVLSLLQKFKEHVFLCMYIDSRCPNDI